MNTYHIAYSQNAGEYTGHLYVTCDEIKRHNSNNCILFVNGIEIELDEEIYTIGKMTDKEIESHNDANDWKY